jgi:hypothetical protein
MAQVMEIKEWWCGGGDDVTQKGGVQNKRVECSPLVCRVFGNKSQGPLGFKVVSKIWHLGF